MPRRELLTSSEREQLLALPRDDGALLRIRERSTAFCFGREADEPSVKERLKFYNVGYHVTDIGIQPTIFTTGELDGVLKMAGEEYEALEV
jgi:hypothetical protein